MREAAAVKKHEAVQKLADSPYLTLSPSLRGASMTGKLREPRPLAAEEFERALCNKGTAFAGPHKAEGMILGFSLGGPILDSLIFVDQ